MIERNKIGLDRNQITTMTIAKLIIISLQIATEVLHTSREEVWLPEVVPGFVCLWILINNTEEEAGRVTSPSNSIYFVLFFSYFPVTNCVLCRY